MQLLYLLFKRRDEEVLCSKPLPQAAVLLLTSSLMDHLKPGGTLLTPQELILRLTTASALLSSSH